MKSLSFTKKLFGGEVEIVVYNSECSEEIINEVYSEALRLQKIFNFFDPESELSRLNKERRLKVSEDLLRVLKKSIDFSEITNGKYDIALGKEIIQRKKGQNLVKTNASYKDIDINGNNVILKNKDVLIDLGSIAKGYITDCMAELLKSKSVKEFMIDSRGDIIFSGEYIHIIGIQHPREEKSLIDIKLRNQAVATSGDYNQFYGSYGNSHIINQNDLISVTVVAETLEEADVYATALFVGDENSRKNLLKNKNIKALFVDKSLQINGYNNFKEIINDK